MLVVVSITPFVNLITYQLSPGDDRVCRLLFYLYIAMPVAIGERECRFAYLVIDIRQLAYS